MNILNLHPIKNVTRRAARGAMLVKGIFLILFFLMMGALGVDFGLYFAMQNQLQTAADAGALAGAMRLHRGTAVTPAERQQEAIDEAIEISESNYGSLIVDPDDVELGYVDPGTLEYDEGTFTTPSNDPDYAATGGYNAVRVIARANDERGGAIPAILANVVGMESMATLAHGVAIMDDQIGAIPPLGGLRPIYGCDAQYEKAKQNVEDGLYPSLAAQPVRIYGDKFMLNGSTQSCPLPTSGNWGFADFNNCGPNSPGGNNIADWMLNGYPGEIDLGKCYSTAPGNFLSSNGVRTALDTLITDKTVALIPLANNFTGSGSNTSVDITGYVGFVFTSYKFNGPESQRYVEGYFTEAFLNAAIPDPAATGGGVAKLRLVH